MLCELASLPLTHLTAPTYDDTSAHLGCMKTAKVFLLTPAAEPPGPFT